MPDMDDFNRMKSLADTLNKVSRNKNEAVSTWVLDEVKLNKAIIENNISEKWAWKKQVIELCKIRPEYLEVMESFYTNKGKERTATNAIKAIENEINILKKLCSEQPK